MRTLNQIRQDIEQASERRSELWHRLGEGLDVEIRAEIKVLEQEIETLWGEHRQTRATMRFGERDHILQRARTEERIERSAA